MVLKVIPTIWLLCVFIFIAVVWTLLFSNIECFLELYIYCYLLVIILSVNGPLLK